MKQQQERDEANNLNYWGSPNKNFHGYQSKKRNNQHRHYQLNNQGHNYEHRVHQPRYNDKQKSNDNYHGFRNDNKLNKTLDNSTNRKVCPTHQAWKEKTV